MTDSRTSRQTRSATEREFDDAYDLLAQRKEDLDALFEFVGWLDPAFSPLAEELDSCYDLLSRL